ncbi:class I SAM-dependent methyltransferase [candidate division WOR-3 bacterium]|nr:class I SAM-dependent methyltransferase [candidate division WOR-3 bacterium]
MYLNPRPTEKSITQYYWETYFPFKRYSRSIIDSIRKYRVKKYAKFVARICDNNKRILEIGCGNGKFLIALRKSSKSALFGVEPSQTAVSQIKEESGINVFPGVVKEAHFPDNYFDMVIMFQVIEHLPNPRSTLEEVHRILKRYGYVICSTPNVDSTEFNFFGKYWYGLDIPRHLYFYSEKTLNRLLYQSGFVIKKVYPEPNPISLYESVRIFLKEQNLQLFYRLVSLLKIPLLTMIMVINCWILLLGKSTRMCIVARKRG